MVKSRLMFIHLAIENYLGDHSSTKFEPNFKEIFLKDKVTQGYFNSSTGVHINEHGALVDGDGLSYEIRVVSPARVIIVASNGQTEWLDLQAQVSKPGEYEK
jgi:hypothetical protein